MNKMHISLILAVAIVFLMVAVPQSVVAQRTNTSESSWDDALLEAGNVLRKSFNEYRASPDCGEQRDNLTLLSAYDVLRRRHGVLDSVVESQNELVKYLFSACPVQTISPYQPVTDLSDGDRQIDNQNSIVFTPGGAGTHEYRLPLLEAYLIMTPEQREIVWNRLAPDEQYFYHSIIADNYQEVLDAIDEYSAQLGQDLTLEESMALPPIAAEYDIDWETLVPHYASPIFVHPSGIYESIHDTMGIDRIVVDNEVLTSFTMDPLTLHGLQPGLNAFPQDSAVTFSLIRTVTAGVGE